MKCRFCGKEIEDDSIFCGYCGKKQPQVKNCVKCGHEIGLEDKWCGYCGASQEEQVQTGKDSCQINVPKKHRHGKYKEVYVVSGIILLLIVWGALGSFAHHHSQTGNVIAETDSTVTSDRNSSFDKSKEHEVVDLGLSVKWATCNIGASTPYESGNYYSWGETSPKEIYNSKTDKYCNCPDDNDEVCYDDHFTKYNSRDGKTRLEPSDDAATVNWGASFRMPTYEEFCELKEKCDWTWDSTHKGYLVTASNGNSIFLPAAGYRYGNEFGCRESYGFYWTSTGNFNSACLLDFDSSSCSVYSDYGRCLGRPIRPVTKQ